MGKVTPNPLIERTCPGKPGHASHLNVSLRKFIALFKPMFMQPPFTFASVYSLGVWLCAGLRLRLLRQFQAFLAVGAYLASARSYLFASIAQLWWRGAFSGVWRFGKLAFAALAFVPNPAVKRTCLRQSAYFYR